MLLLLAGRGNDIPEIPDIPDMPDIPECEARLLGRLLGSRVPLGTPKESRLTPNSPTPDGVVDAADAADTRFGLLRTVTEFGM
jgi:hypothetical protein